MGFCPHNVSPSIIFTPSVTVPPAHRLSGIHDTIGLAGINKSPAGSAAGPTLCFCWIWLGGAFASCNAKGNQPAKKQPSGRGQQNLMKGSG